MFNNQNNKTVIQVLSFLTPSSIARGTVDMANKLIKCGYKSIVISTGGCLVDELVTHGSIHIKMNTATKNWFIMLYNAYKISQIISQYKAGIIHAKSRAPVWSCYIAAKKNKIKFISTFQGLYNINNIFKKTYNNIMLYANQVITISNYLKDHLLKYYKINPNNLSVIYRGVDHDLYSQKNCSSLLMKKFYIKYNVPNNTPVLLLSAKFIEQKGHLILIEALKLIQDLQYYCILVGNLNYTLDFIQKIKNLIEKYKLQNKIQLFGHERNMMGLYSISDIVLSTSLYPEAFSKSLIEAQSMEKLVITTNIGIANEIVKDKKTGFHVSPYNVEQLANTIKYCLSILNTQPAKDITSYARKVVIEKFSIQEMFNNTLSIYKKL